jgi:hypothetical protein
MDKESFQPRQVEQMNRAERRSRIKFYKDEFKKHKAKKPKVDLSLEGEDAEKQIFKMQAWASRYGLLLKKLQELGVDKIKG